MWSFLVSLCVSFVLTGLIIGSARWHARFSTDFDHSQPQKFHSADVARIGGAGVMAGLLAGLLLSSPLVDPEDSLDLAQLACCTMVAFLAGFIEDLTKRVSPKMRLMSTVLAATAALWLVDGVICRSDIPVLDTLLCWGNLPIGPVSVALTLFAVAGGTNSVNLIDGFNGLASMCVTLMLAALAVIAFHVGDVLVLQGALLGLGAVLGFFVWNYPRGLIFLGDGGAYLLGFWVAELGILLVHRNSQVSPLFPILIFAYPLVETLFTIYRRRVVRGQSITRADASHLHSLIYRRLTRHAHGSKRDAAVLLRRNSMTAPYLWALSLTSILPALLFWNNSTALGWLCLGFAALYVWLYRTIIRFHTPAFLLRASPRGLHEAPALPPHSLPR